MSVRLPPLPRRCHLFARRAASLLAVGAGLLLGTAAAPATAADGLRLARSPYSFKAGEALLSQAARYAGKPVVTGADGRHPRGPRRQKGKPPRWRSAPILSFPDGPGRGAVGRVSRRSERPPATRAAQSQAVPRQVLIVLDQHQSGDLANEFARRHGLERKQTQLMSLLNGRCELYELRANRSLAQVMAALRGDPRVRLVQANFRYRTQGASGTPAAVLPQYALDKIALPQAHELARGRDVVVAVIDAAIDQTHPDLQGAITLSFDAVGTPDRRGSFHGTAVAGIIRAQGVVAGAAPQASILAVRAFRVREAGAVAETASWTLLRAIQWAVDNKANVLNLSFVGPKDEALHLALQSATSRRVIAVAAAGNNGPKAAPAYPAAYPEVIAVTAVDEKDHRYAQANRGSYIGFAAPGVDILAPVEKGKHSYLSGTSFATAYVSGIVALLLERNRDLDTGAIIDLIAAGAEDLGPQGRDEDFGAGRVNAFASLKAMERMHDGTNR
jgi:subtilisin family serine protease